MSSQKDKNNWIIINSSFQFHQEVQPTDKESQRKKEELFKKNLEKRVEEQLKKLGYKRF